MWLEEAIFVLKVINIVQENAFLCISRHVYWKNTQRKKAIEDRQFACCIWRKIIGACSLSSQKIVRW